MKGLNAVVLALVAEQRGYAYGVFRLLEERFGAAYQASRSHVYIAMRALEKAGMVRADGFAPIRGARRNHRVMYVTTPRGERQLSAWKSVPDASAEPVRSELVRRLAVATPRDRDALLTGVEAARGHCLALLAADARGKRPRLGGSWESTRDALVHEYGVRGLGAQLAWLNEVHSIVSQLDPDHVDGGLST